ncbi:serine/threonine-protein kinase [Streptomyces sp. NPDC001480]|uniref:serine/threonine-protein kinase n=1 Tax=Streptomyces sp. NPDC001480 TaxID=3364577 RepID=UPI0036CBC8CF
MEGLTAEDPRRVGAYQVLARLGAGGMGKVYLGRSVTGELSAIKLLRAELSHEPDFRKRFARELSAARRVSGRFSAAVLDSDVDAAQVWIATEYVPGPSLAEAVAAFGPLPRTTLLALWLGLLGALQSIHSAGVVHRDLKPSNVLLAPSGPRVIDFGISTLADTSTLTVSGTVLGTPSYMSPEQVLGRGAGPASDVFALGCVMAFAASGTVPFGTGQAQAMLYRIVHQPPDLDGLSGEIAALVRGCLAKEPGDRPQVGELLRALPEREREEASRLLAHGKWLPQEIEGETSDRAGLVRQWDENRSLGVGARTSGAVPLGEDTGADAPAGSPAGGEPKRWDTTEVQVWDSRAARQGPGDAATPPPGGGGPPRDGPPYHPDGHVPDPDPFNEAALWTSVGPVSADTPPLPLTVRRSWRRWFKGGPGAR